MIAIGAIAIRLWAFGGVTFGIGYDDGRYAQVAQNLANGFLPTGPGEWFGTRIVLLWPVATLFRLFGASDYTAVAWPFVGSLVGVLAAYLVGRELAGPRVGLLASALMAAAPLEVEFATRLRPDSWMPALIGLAVWAALRARRGDHAIRWAVAAGALLGCAWSVRESAPIMFPVLAVVLWPIRWRALLAAAAGAIAIPLLSAAAFAAIGGPFKQPLTSTAGSAVWRNPITAWDLNPSYIWRISRDAFDPGSLFFLLLPVLLACAALLAWKRPGPAVVPAVWLAWTALYLEVGTLVNVAKPTRYLTLAAIPVAVLVAIAIEHRAAFLAPLGLGVIAIAALQGLPDREHRSSDVVLANQVAGRLRDLPPGPVLTTNYTWWAKFQSYLATSRLPVPRVPEPTYLTADERKKAARLRPLPQVADYRGGYVVEGPSIRRASWPRNWGIVQRNIRQQVPRAALVEVARIGNAVIYRWPAAIPVTPPAIR